MKKKYPQNIFEYIQNKISSLPNSASLLILLDPDNLLNFQDVFVDNKGRKWKVFFYNDNDFQFRKKFNEKGDYNIIHITNKNLNYIGDILVFTDEVYDFSLKGILKDIIPGESNWPDIIYNYKFEILENINGFVEVYKELRKNLSLHQLLNKSHIKILILGLRHRDINILNIFQFIRESESIQEHLINYINTIFLYKLKEDDINILKEVVKDTVIISKEKILPYLEFSKTELAEYLYLKSLTKRYNLKNDEIILKGLGLLKIDIDEFSENIDYLIKNISEECWNKIVYLAEENLTQTSINKLLDKFNLTSMDDVTTSIVNEKLPLISLSLIYRFLCEIVKNKKLTKNNLLWIRKTSYERLYNSKYEEKVVTLLSTLKKLEFILSTLDVNFEKKDSVNELMDFYSENKIYLLELYFASLYSGFKIIEDKNIKNSLNEIIKNLKTEIENYIENVNQNLYSLISKNVNEFLSLPQLSTNLIRMLMENFQPKKEQKLWILIFDGMRFDTYNEIIKPKICEQFDITKEKLFLCPLPSITDIARVSLLAQKLPSGWKDYNDRYTSDHNILASKAFHLTKEEGKNKLRIIVASETDYGKQKLDSNDNMLYNILIYNLSDDWIHNYRNDIFELNSIIRETFEKNILPDLLRRIGEDDFTILTSDHGFIEMSKENAVEIISDREDQNSISFRYLRGMESEYGIKIKYNDREIYTVAKGRQCFIREKGKVPRYSHGGISMQEMIIPGVVLKKIKKPLISFELILPEILSVVEDKLENIIILVKNTGNQIADFELKIAYGEKEETYSDKLSPNKFCKCEFSFLPTPKINFITIELSYKRPEDETYISIKKVSFEVEERKDKVEIDTSALDRFDDI